MVDAAVLDDDAVEGGAEDTGGQRLRRDVPQPGVRQYIHESKRGGSTYKHTYKHPSL